jgi:hypothetical protein
MLRILSLVRGESPEPFPSPSALDLSKVTPGIGGGVLFTVLAVALVFLLFSMNRHLKKVQFPQDGSES